MLAFSCVLLILFHSVFGSHEDTIWIPIFQCVDSPGSEVTFNGFDVEDIQSLIVKSDARSVLISGTLGDDFISFEYTNPDVNILEETLSRGRAISTIDYDENDWDTTKYCYLEKTEECASNLYIPNDWFTACGNKKGLHILRNGTDSFCTFKKKKANKVASTINIYISSTIGLPTIDNERQVSVFDNLDAMEENVAAMFPEITFISSDEYEELAVIQSNICLIDARTTDEYAIGRLENSTNIPMNINLLPPYDSALNSSIALDIIETECGEDLDELLFVTYCMVGIRAGQMARVLIDELGIDSSNVFVITGSIALWTNERRPMVNDIGYTTLAHTVTVGVGNIYFLPDYRHCC
eukprot:98353_1